MSAAPRSGASDPTAAPHRASGEAIRAGSKSFALASRLYDPATRALVWDLYAWCRHCDDVTDGQEMGHGRVAVDDRAARVGELRAWSDRALAGDGSGGPPFEGLARVVAATGLPARFVHDHLAASRWMPPGSTTRRSTTPWRTAITWRAWSV
jgi:15-cis-phytoene synthase